MKKITLLPLLIGISILLSCQKDITIELPALTPRLVVNCIFDTSEVFTVYVAKVTGLQTDTSTIEGNSILNEAVVTIKELENGYTEELIYNQSLEAYQTSFKPKTHIEYELTATAPNFPPVTSKARTLDPIPLKQVFLEDSVRNLIDNLGPFRFHLVFDDPNKTKNYYLLRIWSYAYYYSFDLSPDNPDPFTPVDSTLKIAPILLTSDDEVIETAIPLDQLNSDFFTFTGQTAFFSDFTFNGAEKHLILEDKQATFRASQKVELEFMTISEDYFRYLRSVQLQQVNQDNPFSEPVKIFSNVENGEGIFTGVGRTGRSLK